MDVLLLPLLIAAVGPLLIVVGLVMYLRGIRSSPDDAIGLDASSGSAFEALLRSLLRSVQAVVLDAGSLAWQRKTAAGLLLIYVGLLYLVVSIIPVTATWITAVIADPPAAVSTATPTPSLSSVEPPTSTPESR